MVFFSCFFYKNREICGILYLYKILWEGAVMAFKVSNKVFEEIFDKSDDLKVIKDPQQVIESFLKRLNHYLKTHKKYPAADAIRKWLEKGGSISSFSCRGDMVEQMIDALRSNAIPFILIQEITGNKGFLIRSKDNEKQRKITNQLLKSSAHYCRITSGKEASQVYLKKRIPNKEMIAIGDITKEQMIYLTERCNQILPGETIGVDKMQDGTYLLTVHGHTAIMGSPMVKGQNFASLLAESVVLFNGNVQAEMNEFSSDTAHFRASKAKGFPDQSGSTKDPVWVVGNENKFVKRIDQGFEVGHAEEIGDEIFLEVDTKISFDDADFEKRLNSALANITKRKVLYRLSDVIAHFKDKKRKQRVNQIAGEKHLMEEVSRIVANKVRGDATFVKGNKWAKKLIHYQAEAGKVLVGVKDGRVPLGYQRDDIKELMDVAFRYGLNMQVITPAIDKLQNIEVYDRPVGPPKVRNVEQEIARFSQDRTPEPNMPTRAVGRDDGR